METLIFLLVWIVCGVIIYLDAKKRNIKAASSWGIIGVLLGVFGVAGYLIMIVIPNKRNV